MVELPVGSLVGLGLIALVLGIVLGRSAKFMRGMGNLHASAHGGSATGGTAAAHQSVSTVVVVDRDGVPLTGGRYDLDAVALPGRSGTFDELEHASSMGELVEGDSDAGWVNADHVAALRAYELANLEDPR